MRVWFQIISKFLIGYLSSKLLSLNLNSDSHKERLWRPTVCLCLCVCWGGVSWFSSSRRLRQDCQFPYASFLQDRTWHSCPCVHLSVTYCTSNSPYTFSRTDVTHTHTHTSLFYALSCWFDHRQTALADGTVCRSDRRVAPDWLRFVSSRRMQLLVLHTQPSQSLLVWVKGLLYRRQEGSILVLCALSKSCRTLGWMMACQSQFWLASCKAPPNLIYFIGSNLKNTKQIWRRMNPSSYLPK